MGLLYAEELFGILMGPQKGAIEVAMGLADQVVMFSAFVFCVDGCALYSLKRAAHMSRDSKIMWALIVLLVPVIGTVVYFCVRPHVHAPLSLPSSHSPMHKHPSSDAPTASPDIELIVNEKLTTPQLTQIPSSRSPASMPATVIQSTSAAAL